MRLAFEWARTSLLSLNHAKLYLDRVIAKKGILKAWLSCANRSTPMLWGHEKLDPPSTPFPVCAKS